MTQVLSLLVVRKLGFENHNELAAIISTQLAIVVIVVTYLTGQAKIDFNAQARASYGMDSKSSDEN